MLNREQCKDMQQYQGTQQHPDTQKEPLGPNQTDYVKRVFGGAYFRDPSSGPMIKKGDKSNEVETKRSSSR